MSIGLAVLVCFACTSDSRRVQVSSARKHGNSYEEQGLAEGVVDFTPKSTKSLATLLHEFKPTAAFAPCSHGCRYTISNPTIAVHRQLAPAMQVKPVYENEIPFLPRPSYLDDNYAADLGFDPLGLVVRDGPWWAISGASTPSRRLAWMREAEVKHSRLAMLAAAGWPLSELWQEKLAKFLGLPDALEVTGGRAPSVLNGNLVEAIPVLILFLIVAGCLEIKTLDQVHGLTAVSTRRNGLAGKTYTPGSLEFDPLGLYAFFMRSDTTLQEEEEDAEYRLALMDYYRRQMEAAEIRNGRLAMCAITGFALQEAILKIPVVDQTPMFFTPLNEVLSWW